MLLMADIIADIERLLHSNKDVQLHYDKKHNQLVIRTITAKQVDLPQKPTFRKDV